MGASSSKACCCWRNSLEETTRRQIRPHAPNVEDEDYQSILDSTSVQSPKSFLLARTVPTPKTVSAPADRLDAAHGEGSLTHRISTDFAKSATRLGAPPTARSRHQLVAASCSVDSLNDDLHLFKSPMADIMDIDEVALSANTDPKSQSARPNADRESAGATVTCETSSSLSLSARATADQKSRETKSELDPSQPQSLTSTTDPTSGPPTDAEYIRSQLSALNLDEKMAECVFEIWRTWYKDQARRFYAASMSLLRSRHVPDRWYASVSEESSSSHAGAPTIEETLWIYRFTVARQGKASAALHMLKEDLCWREDINAEALSRERTTDEFRKALCSVYPHGYYGTDKQGRPVYYDRLGQIDAKNFMEEFSREDMIRYWVTSYECLLRNILPACSVVSGRRIYRGVTVLDLQGISMRTFTRARELLTVLLGITQNHYPETMEKTFIIRSTWVFRTIWKWLKPLLAQETIDKVMFVDDGKELQILMAEIEFEHLPPFISDSHDNSIDWCLRPRGVWLDFQPDTFPPSKQ